MVLTAAVCVVQGITVSAQSGIIGIVMHFLATGSLVLVAGLIYKRKKDLEGSGRGRGVRRRGDDGHHGLLEHRFHAHLFGRAAQRNLSDDSNGVCSLQPDEGGASTG